MKEYYKILGLDENATVDEIRKAYKLYASKYHPDKHSGDKFFEERFKEIKNAYEYLIEIRTNNSNQNYSNQSRGDSFNTQETQNSYESKERANAPKNDNIQFHPIVIWILYLFVLFIPFAGAGFMADVSGGVGAVITFILLFGGYIYFVTKKNG